MVDDGKSVRALDDAADLVAAQVEAVRGGDLQAMDALYNEHVDLVKKIVRDFIHDRDGVADAVQEVFARAIDRLPSLRDPHRFRPWLQSIARHVGTDHLRRTRPGRVVELSEISSNDSDPAERAETTELMVRVHEVLGALSSRDSTVLGLLALGFGPEDIAASLGINRGAAKVAIHRARRRLKSKLGLEGSG